MNIYGANSELSELQSCISTLPPHRVDPVVEYILLEYISVVVYIYIYNQRLYKNHNGQLRDSRIAHRTSHPLKTCMLNMFDFCHSLCGLWFSLCESVIRIHNLQVVIFSHKSGCHQYMVNQMYRVGEYFPCLMRDVT